MFGSRCCSPTQHHSSFLTRTVGTNSVTIFTSLQNSQRARLPRNSTHPQKMLLATTQRLSQAGKCDAHVSQTVLLHQHACCMSRRARIAHCCQPCCCCGDPRGQPANHTHAHATSCSTPAIQQTHQHDTPATGMRTELAQLRTLCGCYLDPTAHSTTHATPYPIDVLHPS